MPSLKLVVGVADLAGLRPQARTLPANSGSVLSFHGLDRIGDVAGLCMSPPGDALVLAVDEKPQIQAATHKTSAIYTGGHKV